MELRGAFGLELDGEGKEMIDEPMVKQVRALARPIGVTGMLILHPYQGERNCSESESGASASPRGMMFPGGGHICFHDKVVHTIAHMLSEIS